MISRDRFWLGLPKGKKKELGFDRRAAIDGRAQEV